MFYNTAGFFWVGLKGTASAVPDSNGVALPDEKGRYYAYNYNINNSNNNINSCTCVYHRPAVPPSGNDRDDYYSVAYSMYNRIVIYLVECLLIYICYG